MAKKILIVEDDFTFLTGLASTLSSEGYKVFTATRGEDALQKHAEEKPDLILLDILMPEINGFEICKQIRKEDSQTPIIMLTSKKRETDKVLGLETGADDYIVKGMGIDEVLARIRTALRRTEVKRGKKLPTDPIEFGDVFIDPKTLKGYRKKENFEISSREVMLLHFFIKHEGEVLTRDVLLQEVWGTNYIGTTRTLDQHIAQLRKKIEDNPENPKHILTVHGEGYRFISAS